MSNWIVRSQLAFATRMLLRKYKPTVVAVTGSVGKTSARNAIAAVLADAFRVRAAAHHYNNEIGVPLTVIGAESPGTSALGWAKVFWKARLLWLRRDASYPNLLVLEFGADRPGDIARLCRLAPPDVTVITAVSPVHAEFFDSIDALASEKGMIVRALTPQGAAVLNGDDPRVMAQKGEATALAYGFGDGADVRAENMRVETREDYAFDPDEEFCVTRFELVIDGERAPVALTNHLGRGAVYAALAAAAVGRRFGRSVDDIVAGLAAFAPQAGRMRPLPGIKGSLLLDDSYNAAPASMAAALETLRLFSPAEGARRVAALGSMAELGSYSENEHRLLGIRAAEVADALVCVGEHARDIRRGALEAGMDASQIEWFADSAEAGRWLDFNVRRGDIVLIKGSQSARMERVTKDLMAEPLRASELLVRQDAAWMSA